MNWCKNSPTSTGKKGAVHLGHRKSIGSRPKMNIEHGRFHDVESQGPSYEHQTRGATEFGKSRSQRLRRDADIGTENTLL
jgi:hypothetical protein